MKILDLITARRTVHSYTSEVVPREIIDRAVLAAIHAPNHKHTWPWRFYLVGLNARKKLASLQVKLAGEKAPLNEAGQKATYDKFLEPGALIIAAIKKSSDAARVKEDYAAMACALQNMALVIADAGYGSKWGTGRILRSGETYQILGISEDDHEICGLFWIGKAKNPPVKPERPPIKEFLFNID